MNHELYQCWLSENRTHFWLSVSSENYDLRGGKEVEKGKDGRGEDKEGTKERGELGSSYALLEMI